MATGIALDDRSADEASIDSLLQLELFETAVEACQSRIQMTKSKGDLAKSGTFNALAKWSILQMKCMSAQAIASPNVYDQPAQLDRTLDAMNEIAKEMGDSPRGLWVRHKQWWNHWFIASRALAAFQSAPARENLKNWTLESIRKSLDQLEILEAEVAKRPAQGIQKDTKGAPTSAQWLALTNDVQLLKSDLLAVRANFYPSKSTERIAAATEMITAIDKAVQKSGDDALRVLLFELARCRAWMLLNRSDEVILTLKAISQKQTLAPKSKSKRNSISIAAIAAEAYRSMGKLDESEQALIQAGGWQAAPELAIEHFANVVRANNASEALQLKKEIGQRFGRYWEQRSDAILVGSRIVTMPAGGLSNDLLGTNKSSGLIAVELLMTEAKQWIAAKAWEKAFDKLSQAEQAAANSGDDSRALEIAMKIGALMVANQEVNEGRSEFFRAAVAYSKEPQAPIAAMMSVWDFSTTASFSRVPAELDEASAAIARGRLAEILRLWPTSTQADIACTKLEEYYLRTDDLASLNSLWLKRIGANPSAEVVDQAALRLSFIGLLTQDQWLEAKVSQAERFFPETRDVDLFRAGIEKHAPTELRSELQKFANEFVSPSYRTPTSQQGFRSMNIPSTLRRLTATLNAESSVSVDDKPLRAIDLLMVCSLRCELAYREAIATRQNQGLRSGLQALESALSEQSKQLGHVLLEKLQRLRDLYQLVDQAISKEWAEVKVEVSRRLEGSAKDPWWPYRAARLHQVLPNGADEFALQQYRKLAQGLRAGGDAWLEMRCRSVEVLRKLNRIDEATKLTELVLVTYPDLSSYWRERFQ